MTDAPGPSFDEPEPVAARAPLPVKSRRRARVASRLGTLGVLVVVIAAGVGLTLVKNSQSAPQAAKRPVVLTPVKVLKTDLSTFTTVSGTLGYGSAITISEGGAITAMSNAAPGATVAGAAFSSPASISATPAVASASGQPAAILVAASPTTTTSGARSSSASTAPTSSTPKSSASTTATSSTTVVPSSTVVTSLAKSGTTVNRGETIYSVGDQRRVLFYGAIPMWRDLSGLSASGYDIYELNQNLAAMGFDSDNLIASSDAFTTSTINAVQRWQQQHGFNPTGTITLGQIVVLDGPVQIGALHVDVGGSAKSGSAIVDATVLSTVAPVLASHAGSVTKIAKEGEVIKAGSVLLAVDGQPVVALSGTTDLSRELAIGVAEGDDVRTLKANLVALGYDPQKAISVDDSYDAPAVEAVKRLQVAVGFNADGLVHPGQYVALGDGLAVGKNHVELAAQVVPDTPVIELTRSHRQVSVGIAVTKRSTLNVGDSVQVVFPDTSQQDGVIVGIGSVAATAVTDRNTTTTVPVTIVVKGVEDPTLTSFPVDVNFVAETVKGVLAVPTGALIALKEGGFGVQVSDGGNTRLIGVTVGLYSNGLAQVTGDGIGEGTQVMVSQ